MSDEPKAAELRVLVVEDDYLVAKALALTLRGLGCRVVGPCSAPDDAVALVKAGDVDAAILDVRLAPGTSAPVARALQYRGCPFVFVTGYTGIDVLPDDLRGFRVLHKPVDQETLKSAVDELTRQVRRPEMT